MKNPVRHSIIEAVSLCRLAVPHQDTFKTLVLGLGLAHMLENKSLSTDLSKMREIQLLLPEYFIRGFRHRRAGGPEVKVHCSAI
jgi:hypothetical protein